MTSPEPGFSAPEDIESAFYSAFTQCDIKAMGRVWAADEVLCVHPGSHAILGREAVMRSWAYIFDGAELPDIQVNVLTKSVSDTLAVHVVEEHISTGKASSAILMATNVYRKFGDDWLMVEHHGSVIQSQPDKHTLQ